MFRTSIRQTHVSAVRNDMLVSIVVALSCHQWSGECNRLLDALFPDQLVEDVLVRTSSATCFDGCEHVFPCVECRPQSKFVLLQDDVLA